MPYGTVTGERGLIFLAYANTVDKFDQMLDRMTGLVDGTADNVFKFSR
jgi:putative iron-dependent peroxidase